MDVVWQGAAVPGDSVAEAEQRLLVPRHPAGGRVRVRLDLANQILDDAGYTERTPDGVRSIPRAGTTELRVLPVTDQQGATETAQLMTGWMEQIGIEFRLKPVAETRAYVDWEQGTFDAYLWSWGGDPDPDFDMSIYITSQCLGWSDGCYSNPTLDELYDEQRTTFDKADRRRSWTSSSGWRTRNPEIVLAYPQILSAYRTDKFEGYVRSPSDGSVIFAWRVDSYLNLTPVTGSTTSGGGGRDPSRAVDRSCGRRGPCGGRRGDRQPSSSRGGRGLGNARRSSGSQG